SQLRGVAGAVRTEGDALHVAVPAGPDRGVAGVVGGDRAVGGDPQDLAVERVLGGGVRRFEGVAGPGPQVPVRAVHDPAAVVPVGGLDAGPQDLRDGERAEVLGDGGRDHPVLLPAGDVAVDRAVAAKSGEATMPSSPPSAETATSGTTPSVRASP